jgi:hypothetical protein
MYVITVRENGNVRVSPEFATRLSACRHYAEVISAYAVVRTVEYCAGNYELELADGSKVLINIIDLDALDA